MRKNIAILGASGFIGQNLVEYFLGMGYEVTAVSRTKCNFRSSAPTLRCVEANIEDTAALLNYVKDCEQIVWLVSATIPASALSNLSEDFGQNIRPLIALLESAAGLPKLRKFIFLSSGGTIYGDPPSLEPIREDAAKLPISSYGLSKVISEEYISFLTRNRTFESIIFRPSNVYGPYQNLKKPQGVIGYAFKSIIENSSIDLYDNGVVIRDFLYVKDLAKALHLSIEHPERNPGETRIFNVGSQEGHSIKSIIEKVGSVAQRTVQTVAKQSRSFDCAYNVLNVEKIASFYGWQPETSLNDGLQAVWNWLKKELA
jgi:UDP-glucose 4-epimerase